MCMCVCKKKYAVAVSTSAHHIYALHTHMWTRSDYKQKVPDSFSSPHKNYKMSRKISNILCRSFNRAQTENFNQKYPHKTSHVLQVHTSALKMLYVWFYIS